MLCAYPVHLVGQRCRLGYRGVACGKCMPCRINSRRQKTGRLILEGKCHERASFVTLTYAEENEPADRNLSPADFKLWMMRFRERLDRPFRYFGVGEYGSKTQRPHYHAILFGVDPMECEHKKLLHDTWGKGFVMASETSLDRYAYVAQYCTKKMTSESHPDLDGREPEFSRQSMNPGISGHCVKHLTNYYYTRGGAAYLQDHGDIAHSFRHNSKIWPFDRYMLEKIRTELGVPSDERGRFEMVHFRTGAGPSLEFETDLKPLAEREVKYRDELHQSRLVHDKEWQKRKSHGTL